MESMKVTINDIEFKNPIIAASGTFGFGEEYNKFYDVGILGGICSKGLTLNPKDGNEGLRIYETESGIMNSVGLQNPGIDAFIQDELPKMKKFNTNIIANLGGGTIEEYIKGAEKLNNTDIQMIELNISCPNVKSGGMAFGIKCESALKVFSEVRSVTNKKIMVKLSPNAENIVEMAYELCAVGADSISLINTIKAMAIDINKRKPVFNNIFAGLSGPSIKPIALRMVYEVYREIKTPIIGIGGICNYKDVIEFMLAGASAVQIGTSSIINPKTGIEIINNLKNYLKDNNICKISDIIGKAH